MLGVVEVRLEAGDIVKLNHRGKRVVLFHQVLIGTAVSDAVPDVEPADARNAGGGSRQGIEHCLPACVGDPGFWAEQNDVKHHVSDEAQAASISQRASFFSN